MSWRRRCTTGCGAPGALSRNPLRWDADLGVDSPAGQPPRWRGRSMLHRDAGGEVDGFLRYHVDDSSDAHRSTVHQAMTARGYRGDARTLDGFRLRPVDAAWSGAALLVAVALLVVDRRLGV